MPKRERRKEQPERDEERGVYVISVAAELAGVHPQTLRIYERKGLIRPARTAGNTRRYSERDIERLRMIQRLTQELGINLAGVKRIVEMEGELEQLRARLERMDRELERARQRMREEVERLRARAQPAEIVPLSAVQRWRVELRRKLAEGRDGGQGQRRGPIAVGPARS
ncbi:MAG TPA: helix-turn-helix transcriptional regulator [Actinomycetota bacterium]|nr:helix-turn-helix transcriptional regulator [Actinomycetota bacterium]